MYDQNNIFNKIIKGDIPCNKICENNYALSFYDINPQAKIHVLVIPKGHYTNLLDFTTNASTEEQKEFFKLFNDTIIKLNITEGFRTIANTGLNGGQEVPHFHFHILAGEKIGSLNHK